LPGKEKQLAFPLDQRNGAAKIPPKIIEVKRRHRGIAFGRRIRQFGALIFRIEIIVLDELKTPTVILLSSALGNHVDGSGSGAPELRVIIRRLYVHFLNEIDAYLIEHTIV
jgi:hypothetical protein